MQRALCITKELFSVSYFRLFLGFVLFLFSTGVAIAQTNGYATSNQFFAKGTPTFIVGTKGDDKADKLIRGEAEFIRDLLFPKAKIIDDTQVVVENGVVAWPLNPILYGGPHVNSVLDRLKGELPFHMDSGVLSIGGKDFKGSDYGLIAVVPAKKSGNGVFGYPEFLLYAGTGMPGVGGINSVWHGNEPLLITDRFGRMISATWRAGASSLPEAYFPPQDMRRTQWRPIRAASANEKVKANIFYPKKLGNSPNEKETINAIMRGLNRAVTRLSLSNPVIVNVFLYPDRKSKEYLTNNKGDGHVSLLGNTLHVLPFDLSEGGSMESLVAHESTHIYAYRAWGPAGSALMGEGLAVWVSGGYGGKSLLAYKQVIKGAVSDMRQLLGKKFNQYPEAKSYPLAGLFVSAIIDTVGLERFTDFLYNAHQYDWEEKAKEAGSSANMLHQAFVKTLSESH